MMQDPHTSDVDFPLHPGRYLQMELQARNQTHQALSSTLDCSEEDLQAVLSGERPITPDLAYQLERCWGISMTLLLDLQRDHDAARERQTPLNS